MAKFKFNRSFQIDILSLMYQKWDFLVFSADVIDPAYFDDKVLIWFFTTMVNHYRKYNESPHKNYIENELLKAASSKSIKQEEFESFSEVFKELDEAVLSEQYVREEVIRFCKTQATKKAILEIGEMLYSEDDGVWDTIGKKIDDARSVGSSAMDLGLNYIATVEDRAARREFEDELMKASSGIYDLDLLLGGGIETQQMIIWMGGTGAGKSLALAGAAKKAFTERLKVIYYTLELSEDIIARRFDSCFSKIPMSDLTGNATRVVHEVKRWGRRYGENLIIKQYAPRQASVNTIRAHLTMLSNSGFKPDVVVVDYLDLLKPLTSYNDEYADLGAVATDLRGLAVDFDVPLMTATQVNRAGMQSDVVELVHVSDSLKKLFVADIVVAICRNRDEKNQNRARIFIAKNRNGPEGREVPIRTAYERMTFYAGAADNDHMPSEADSNVTTSAARRAPVLPASVEEEE